MRFMRTNAQTIKHQDFQVAQAFDRRRRNLAEISRVGKIVEAIGNDGQATMNYFEWRHFQITAEAEWRTVDHRVRHYLRQAAAKMRGLKDVLKNSANIFPCTLVRVQTQRAMAKIKRANVVKTENVIRVAMRNQHRVEMFDFMFERLLAKVG